MLSIFIMYSTDRKKPLAHTMRCLQRMTFYDKCQKTLVVDGRADEIYEGWNIVQVPRIGGKFCWARMWDAGVETAWFEKIVYLDSDRLLPPNYLELVLEKLVDRSFVFTSKHFQMMRELDSENCNEFFQRSDEPGVFLEDKFLGSVRYEPRSKAPLQGYGKNVMSGSTAFTKSVFRKLGGVDPWYCGHGAFADTDFHFAAAQAGMKFIDLGIPELHFPHPKSEKGVHLSDIELRRKGLDNFIYYCHKWRLPLVLAEGMAEECDMDNPARYVDRRLRELNLSPGNS